VVVVGLGERRALDLRHRVVAAAVGDRIPFVISLPRCLGPLKPLLLAVEGLVVLLLRLIVQTETLELLAAILRLELLFKLLAVVAQDPQLT
jgi:hypothetical protein